MTLDDARDIVRRYGEKTSQALLVERRIKELEARRVTLAAEILAMSVNVASAAAYIEAHEAGAALATAIVSGEKT